MFILTAGHNPTRPAGIIGLYHFPDGMPEPPEYFSPGRHKKRIPEIQTTKEPARRRKS